MTGPSRLERLPKTYLPPLTENQTPYALAAACVFALLYTETGAYSVRMAGARGQQESVVLLVTASVIVLGGFLVSLVLPLRTQGFPEGEFTDVRPVVNYLAGQFRTSVVVFGGSSAAALAIYVWLVWPDLVATYNLIKDIFIYTMVGVLYYHFIVSYVRHAAYLYRTKMDNAQKLIVGEAVMALLTLILALYLITLDVTSLARVSDPTGLIGLHVVVRDIWMTIIIVLSYGWHLKYLADH